MEIVMFPYHKTDSSNAAAKPPFRFSDRRSLSTFMLMAAGIPWILGGFPAPAGALTAREIMQRVNDRNVGYWQPGLAGMDHLSRREMGTLLTRYLGLSEDDVAEAVEKMAAAGDYDLAARTLTWATAAKPPGPRLSKAQKTVFLKLKEKYQAFNPFKFIIYSETVGSELAALKSPQPGGWSPAGTAGRTPREVSAGRAR